MSCGQGFELTEIYSQQIEQSDKAILDYQALSFINDGMKFGKTILDKNEIINLGEEDQLSFDFLIGNPQKDTLRLIDLKKGSTKSPQFISTEISTFKGITIKRDYYSCEDITFFNLAYKFSSLRETKDSLIFLGLEKDYFNIPTNNNEIGFLKGNIKLIESDSLKAIKKIEIPAFLLNHNSNTSVDNVTIIRNDSLQIDGLVLFSFEPLTLISASKLSDIGIYRRRKIKDLKTLQ
jgi:hypothetical protein